MEITAHDEDKRTHIFTLNTKIIEQANILRRAMFHVETWAIDYVTFYINKTEFKDEVIASILGLLPVDNDTLVKEYEIDDNERILEHVFPIHVVAGDEQRLITTKDIEGLPFVKEFPILLLNTNQELHCTVILKKGNGNLHDKWKPAACIRVYQENEDEDTQLLFISKDMMDPETIVERAIVKIPAAEKEKPLDIFSKPVVIPFQ